MTRSEDIIFIVPPSRWHDPRCSLGVMYVSSYLRQYGHDNVILDDRIMEGHSLGGGTPITTIAEFIRRTQPTIVGITCLINEIRETVDLNNAIKEVSPETKTLVGGTQAFDTPEIFLRNGVDYVVRGEGELTTHELVETLCQGEEVGRVKGISWMKNGAVTHNRPRPPIMHLDDLPYPSYDLVNMRRHTAIHSWVIRGMPLKTATVLSSRGCPYSCSFCECNAIFGKKVRYRSRDDIRGEVRLLRDNYGAEAIWFVDDALTMNKEHLNNVCDVMKELGMWWGCQGRVNNVNTRMIKRMRETGCIQIDLGVESGSNRILREVIDKRITVEQTKIAFRICHKHNMRTLANLMIGLPTETKEEMLQTLRLGKEIDADSYVLSIATPMPNTKLWDMVNPNIDEDKLYKINFFDSEVLDKFNKSEVKDLLALRREFLFELDYQHLLRKKLSDMKWFMRILLKTRHKKEYFSCHIFSFRSVAKTVLLLLDSLFGTNLRVTAHALGRAYYASKFLNVIRRIVGPTITRIRYRLGIGWKSPLRLHLGCGDKSFQDYVNIDLRKTKATDLVCGITRLPYPDNSVEVIEAYHVIEHLSRHDLPKALREWHRILKPQGKLIVECPDFDKIAGRYLAGDEKQLDGIFALQRFEGDYHFFGYNFERLSRALTNTGFTEVVSKTARDYHTKTWPCIRAECMKEESEPSL